MPQETFVRIPPNLLSREWVEKQAAANKPWSTTMAATSRRSRAAAAMIDLQNDVVVPLDQLKAIHKRMNEGARRCRATPRRR